MSLRRLIRPVNFFSSRSFPKTLSIGRLPNLMPVMGGIEAAHRLMGAGSKARIAFLTVHEDPEFIREAFAAGASGYVIKSRLASDLIAAANEVLAGRSFTSPFSSATKG